MGCGGSVMVHHVTCPDGYRAEQVLNAYGEPTLVFVPIDPPQIVATPAALAPQVPSSTNQPLPMLKEEGTKLWREATTIVEMPEGEKESGKLIKHFQAGDRAPKEVSVEPGTALARIIASWGRTMDRQCFDDIYFDFAQPFPVEAPGSQSAVDMNEIWEIDHHVRISGSERVLYVNCSANPKLVGAHGLLVQGSRLAELVLQMKRFHDAPSNDPDRKISLGKVVIRIKQTAWRWFDDDNLSGTMRFGPNYPDLKDLSVTILGPRLCIQSHGKPVPGASHEVIIKASSLFFAVSDLIKHLGTLGRPVQEIMLDDSIVDSTMFGIHPNEKPDPPVDSTISGIHPNGKPDPVMVNPEDEKVDSLTVKLDPKYKDFENLSVTIEGGSQMVIKSSEEIRGIVGGKISPETTIFCAIKDLITSLATKGCQIQRLVVNGKEVEIPTLSGHCDVEVETSHGSEVQKLWQLASIVWNRTGNDWVAIKRFQAGSESAPEDILAMDDSEWRRLINLSKPEGDAIPWGICRQFFFDFIQSFPPQPTGPGYSQVEKEHMEKVYPMEAALSGSELIVTCKDPRIAHGIEKHGLVEPGSFVAHWIWEKRLWWEQLGLKLKASTLVIRVEQLCSKKDGEVRGLTWFPPGFPLVRHARILLEGRTVKVHSSKYLPGFVGGNRVMQVSALDSALCCLKGLLKKCNWVFDEDAVLIDAPTTQPLEQPETQATEDQVDNFPALISGAAQVVEPAAQEVHPDTKPARPLKWDPKEALAIPYWFQWSYLTLKLDIDTHVLQISSEKRIYDTLHGKILPGSKLARTMEWLRGNLVKYGQWFDKIIIDAPDKKEHKPLSCHDDLEELRLGTDSKFKSGIEVVGLENGKSSLVCPERIAPILANVDVFNPQTPQLYQKHSRWILKSKTTTPYVLLANGIPSESKLMTFFENMQLSSEDMSGTLDMVRNLSRDELHLRSSLDGLTALGAAIKANADLSVIEMLIRRGSPITGDASGGWSSPLHILAARGDTERFRLIVELGIANRTLVNWEDTISLRIPGWRKPKPRELTPPRHLISELKSPLITGLRWSKYGFVSAVLPYANLETKRFIFHRHYGKLVQANPVQSIDLRLELESTGEMIPCGTMFHEVSVCQFRGEEGTGALLPLDRELATPEVIKLVDSCDWSCLHIAAMLGRAEVCRAIMGKCPELVFTGPKLFACVKPGLPLSAAFKEQLDSQLPFRLPLYLSIRFGHWECAKALLDVMDQQPWALGMPIAAEAILHLAISRPTPREIQDRIIASFKRAKVKPSARIVRSMFQKFGLPGLTRLCDDIGVEMEWAIALHDGNDDGGMTLLDLAVRANQPSLETIQFVVQGGGISESASKQDQLIMDAIRARCDAEIVTYLLERMPSITVAYGDFVAALLLHCPNPLDLMQTLSLDQLGEVHLGALDAYLFDPHVVSPVNKQVLDLFVPGLKKLFLESRELHGKDFKHGLLVVTTRHRMFSENDPFRGGEDTFLHVAKAVVALVLRENNVETNAILYGLALAASRRKCQSVMALVMKHCVELDTSSWFAPRFIFWTQVCFQNSLDVPFLEKRGCGSCPIPSLRLVRAASKDRNYLNRTYSDYGPALWGCGDQQNMVDQDVCSGLTLAVENGFGALVKTLVTDFRVLGKYSDLLACVRGATLNRASNDEAFLDIFELLVSTMSDEVRDNCNLEYLVQDVIMNTTFAPKVVMKHFSQVPVKSEVIAQILSDPKCRTEAKTFIAQNGTMKHFLDLFKGIGQNPDLHRRTSPFSHLLSFACTQKTSHADMLAVVRECGAIRSEDQFHGIDLVCHFTQNWECLKYLYETSPPLRSPKKLPPCRMKAFFSNPSIDTDTIQAFVKIHRVAFTTLSSADATERFVKQLLTNPNVGEDGCSIAWEEVLRKNVERMSSKERDQICRHLLCFVLQNGAIYHCKPWALEWVIDRVAQRVAGHLFGEKDFQLEIFPIALGLGALPRFVNCGVSWNEGVFLSKGDPAMIHRVLSCAIEFGNNALATDIITRNGKIVGDAQPWIELIARHPKESILPVLTLLITGQDSKEMIFRNYVRTLLLGINLCALPVLEMLAKIRRDRGSFLESIHSATDVSAILEKAGCTPNTKSSNFTVRTLEEATKNFPKLQGSFSLGHLCLIPWTQVQGVLYLDSTWSCLSELIEPKRIEIGHGHSSFTTLSLRARVRLTRDCLEALEGIASFPKDLYAPPFWFGVIGSWMLSMEESFTFLLKDGESLLKVEENIHAFLEYLELCVERNCVIFYRTSPWVLDTPLMAKVLQSKFRDEKSVLGTNEFLKNVSLDLRVSKFIRALALDTLFRRDQIELIGPFGTSWVIPIAVTKSEEPILEVFVEHRAKSSTHFPAWELEYCPSKSRIKYGNLIPGIVPIRPNLLEKTSDSRLSCAQLMVLADPNNSKNMPVHIPDLVDHLEHEFEGLAMELDGNTKLDPAMTIHDLAMTSLPVATRDLVQTATSMLKLFDNKGKWDQEARDRELEKSLSAIASKRVLLSFVQNGQDDPWIDVEVDGANSKMNWTINWGGTPDTFRFGPKLQAVMKSIDAVLETLRNKPVKRYTREEQEKVLNAIYRESTTKTRGYKLEPAYLPTWKRNR